MKDKDLFKQETRQFGNKENQNTVKRAHINAKSNVPRLEVAGKFKILSNKAFGIGRDKTNQLIIADPAVSRYHAIIAFEDYEAYIKDTESTNGTYVNGTKVPKDKKVLLKNGDRIKVGTTVIIYHK
jgi:pSer/pThr/pTyr-binding forkhead associated (FHA) protein